MGPSVEQMLRESYTDGVFHSHVSMVRPRGKFQLDRQRLEDFWEAYCSRIANSRNAVLGVAEKPQHYLPVLADVDLKVEAADADLGEHLYTEDNVSQVVSAYQSVLRHIVKECTGSDLLCVLLEKPIYYIDLGKTMYAKNGFHLHFPNLFLSKVDQEIHLIPRVKAIVQELGVFANLGIEDSSTVIDGGYCTAPWLLYGGRKSEDMDPYKATRVFDSEGVEIGLEDALGDYRIYDAKEKAIPVRGKVEYYLPRILSIIPYGRTARELRSGLVSPLKKALQEKRARRSEPEFETSVEEALKVSEQLLPMLADWRAADRNEWMRVGWALNNIGNGSAQALDQWMEFSARCPEKYNEENCIYEWQKMVKRDLTLGTLMYYASTDSPEAYEKFKSRRTRDRVAESLDGSHNDIAKVMFSEYGNEFVCASISNKMWFQFRGHRWEEIEEGVFLRERISSSIVARYADMGKEIFAKLARADKTEQDALNVRLKQVQKIVCNLKSSPYKNNVMKEAMEVFYDHRFQQRLDQNPYMIGFKNGVYDLRSNEFRPGSPEDYISKVLPIEFREYQEGDEAVLNVIDFLTKVFPDPEIRTYFLDTYSDVFVGGNNQKKVYLWTGDGDNGKSITQMFFDEMLGELAVKFNTQYFTGKKVATGNANPELARAAPPVRLVTMEEPDADEQLKIGEMKKLSGGDKFWARDLFERGKKTKEVTPMFMLTFICNRLPKLRFSDKATWARLRVLPFEATFTEPGEPCPETFEEQLAQKRFPMNKDLKYEIPNMVPAFAWYLLEWRKSVSVRKEPEKVQEATALYRRRSDVYRQFVEECIAEGAAWLTLTEMYAHFKEWFKEGWPNTTPPTKNEVKEHFEKLWGVEARAKWYGYRVRTLGDEVEACGVATGPPM